MSDLSITERLTAYGQWVCDDSSNLSCKSPSLMLMRSAPKLCAKDVKSSRKSTARLFISDEDALAVDRAMGALIRHSVHLHNIVWYHFIKGHAVDVIAKQYWSKFEYPKGGRFATAYHVKPLLTEGVGFISGFLIKDLV